MIWQRRKCSYFAFELILLTLELFTEPQRFLPIHVSTQTHSILTDYEVSWKQKLGCGISGPVRPCKRKTTGERFALKCLIDRPRARQEVLLQQQCSAHPHIVNIYDVYANEVQFPGEPETKSRLLVVMELMDGGELFDRISRQKYFTERKAAKYTKQIALAIERCHMLNIAHRDIKPENLLLKDNSEDAVIKLSDFGFAKVDDGNLMTPHFTPYYVAPQVLEAQKRKGRERYCIVPQGSPYTYDKSCDMWSLGVIIYIMLCGYPPFYSETPSKQLSKMMKKKIMAGQYEFPKEDWSHISKQAKELVTSLLKVDPMERQTVTEVLEHTWLTDAPNTELQSPAVMMDKAALFEAQQAHSEQLTTMRLLDTAVTLKPLREVNNPILKKRQNVSMNALHDQNSGETRNKDSVLEVATQKLRDVIAHCILPPKDKRTFEDSLGQLVHELLDYTSCFPALPGILCNYSWNGRRFQSKVDVHNLARALSELLRQTNLAAESRGDQDTESEEEEEMTMTMTAAV